MSAKNEPECWVCKNFDKVGEVAICREHEFPIPRGTSDYFICCDFSHYAFPDIGLEFALANKADMKADVLYTYRFMDVMAPREYSTFQQLAQRRDGQKLE